MKKLLLSVVIALGAMTISAQEAGSMWIGGSVGFSYVDPKGGDSQTSYKILPEFGYVLSENLGVGVNLGYAYYEGISEYQGIDFSNANDIKGFVVSPFLRYTFMKGSLGSLFIDGGVGYSQFKGGGIKVTAIEAGFKPGLAFTLTEKVSLIGKFGFLGYNHVKVENSKANGFGLDLDLSNIQIGAAIHF